VRSDVTYEGYYLFISVDRLTKLGIHSELMLGDIRPINHQTISQHPALDDFRCLQPLYPKIESLLASQPVDVRRTHAW
jgi:hypothetical protein